MPWELHGSLRLSLETQRVTALYAQSVLQEAFIPGTQILPLGLGRHLFLLSTIFLFVFPPAPLLIFTV